MLEVSVDNITVSRDKGTETSCDKVVLTFHLKDDKTHELLSILDTHNQEKTVYLIDEKESSLLSYALLCKKDGTI